MLSKEFSTAKHGMDFVLNNRQALNSVSELSIFLSALKVAHGFVNAAASVAEFTSF